jgi:hypothetical protein
MGRCKVKLSKGGENLSSREFTLENMAHLIPYYDIPGEDESGTDRQGSDKATSAGSSPSVRPEQGNIRLGVIEHAGPLATAAALPEDLLYGLTGSLEAMPYEEALLR